MTTGDSTAHGGLQQPRGISGLIRDRFGGLPSSFTILWAGTLVNRAGTFVAPFLVLYLTQHRHVSGSYVTPILIGYGVGVLASSPIGGLLADRLGRRPTMVFGLASAASCQLMLAVADSTAVIALLIVFLGLASDLYRPAANALVADVVPADDRPRAYGLLHWATNLGVPVAALGAGWFASHNWTVLFLVDAATALVFAGLVLWKVPANPPTPDEAGQAAQNPAEPVKLWQDRGLLGACAISLVAFAIYFQSTYAVPLQVVSSGLRSFDYGIMMATNGVLIAVVQPLLGPTLSRIPRQWGLGAGLLLVGGGIALTGVATNLPVLLFSVAVWSLGEIALAALLPAVVAELAPAEARGRYMGAFGASLGLAGVVAPLGVSLFETEPSLLWTVCVGAAVLLAVVQGRFFGGNAAVAAADHNGSINVPGKEEC
ncbi:MDR family MFS transporter [Kitasatospora sp. NPDC001547]|uniref:MDR family MFS transporter n=1 Tax=Kitasatospora sp. NPDC001547 TaxID=3364015 RepID=UPI0036B7A0A6|nr:MFS transporter [Kitasatospora sp. Xyl93]